MKQGEVASQRLKAQKEKKGIKVSVDGLTDLCKGTWGVIRTKSKGERRGLKGLRNRITDKAKMPGLSWI